MNGTQTTIDHSNNFIGIIAWPLSFKWFSRWRTEQTVCVTSIAQSNANNVTTKHILLTLKQTQPINIEWIYGKRKTLSLSLLLILTQIYLCAILFDFFALNALRCRLDVCMYKFKSTTFFCRHRCRSGKRYRLRFWFLWLFHCSVTWSCKVHTHMILSSRSLQHRTM